MAKETRVLTKRIVSIDALRGFDMFWIIGGVLLILYWAVMTLFLLLSGAGCLASGIVWNFVFPINKLIWTSSYMLYAGGWSLLLLALFYWIMDVKGWQKWAFPFVVIGMNPITIYVAQRLFDFGSVASIFVHGFVDSLGAAKPLFWALCVFLVKWLSLLFLYRRRIFLKV